jgi:hypothetical protein
LCKGNEIGRERVETQPRTARGENCAWLARDRRWGEGAYVTGPRRARGEKRSAGVRAQVGERVKSGQRGQRPVQG